MNACDQAMHYGTGLSEFSVGYPWISHINMASLQFDQ